ncbi:MAG: hypothetical protein RLZZ597_2156 [Cyanobacteriota bacterium]|jgi:hypothetical protein
MIQGFAIRQLIEVLYDFWVLGVINDETIVTNISCAIFRHHSS